MKKYSMEVTLADSLTVNVPLKYDKDKNEYSCEEDFIKIARKVMAHAILHDGHHFNYKIVDDKGNEIPFSHKW
ncbi:MAG: hypothetical protein HQP61_01955 [Peptococcaceae bacterium]|nr:hypothetical protein [Candidatus Syntrophopropionicum ammoniitolerans]